MSNLQCDDIKFIDEHLEIPLKSSKTDQYRDGHTVLVARTGKDTCPVAMLEHYIRRAEIQLGTSDYLFQNITKTKRVRGCVSLATSFCTSARELVRQML